VEIGAAVGWAQAIVGLVALQRLGELAVARRNTRRLLAAGGLEHGRRHYPLIVALHAGWLAALAVGVPADRAPDPVLLGAFVALQAGRVWTIATLGPRWTTRIVVVPGAEPVRRGPYRLAKHPNYAIVMAEIVVLPLAFGAVGIAVAFGALNVGLLAWRIRVEARALDAARVASPVPGSTATGPPGQAVPDPQAER